MKRTPLKRKTPLKRGNSQLKRTPLKKISKSKSATDRRSKYAKSKKEYMSNRKFPDSCERCGDTVGIKNLDLHHKAGRSGDFMHDQDFFAALCRTCHNQVHEYPKESREAGWLT